MHKLFLFAVLISLAMVLPACGDGPAPLDLKFTSVDGQSIDLSKMRGKVVLVDFWATWCPPCRGEVPNVVAAYQKYHDKGFEIIGISLDEDKDTLAGFIKEKEMTWPQYYDGKQWQNKMALKYGVTQIPSTYLLGKDGKIIAKQLRGEELDSAVAKALNAN